MGQKYFDVTPSHYVHMLSGWFIHLLPVGVWIAVS